MINICYVVDEKYFEYMMVCMYSIISNTQNPYDLSFYILLDNVDIEKQEFCKRRFSDCCIHFKNISGSDFDGFETRNHISLSAYKKILIFKMLDVSKVIYLDADTIVNTDIGELWEKLDDSFEFGAIWNPFYDYDNEYLDNQNNERTFNSGVMLLNFNSMDKNYYYNRLYEFIKENNGLTKLHDQAAFNYVFKSNWKSIDISWNVQSVFFEHIHKKLNLSKEELSEIRNNPSIIHFTSNSKPWQFRNVHPYKSTFQNYYYSTYGVRCNNSYDFADILKYIRDYSYYKLIILMECISNE